MPLLSGGRKSGGGDGEREGGVDMEFTTTKLNGWRAYMNKHHGLTQLHQHSIDTCTHIITDHPFGPVTALSTPY